MKKLFSLFIFVFLFLSCMDIEVKIILNPDGSGIVQKKILFSNEIVEMIKGFSAGAETTNENGEVVEGTEQNAEQEFSLLNEQELKDSVASMGEGVEYKESSAIKTDTQQGYLAIYTFSDINKLKINQNPSDSMPDTSGGAEKEFLSFSLKKDKVSTLKVIFPEEKEEAVTADETSIPEQPTDESQIMMMKQMFKDMRIAIIIELNGKIEKTNASYVNASTVTLMDINFNEIVGNDEKLKQISTMKTGSIEGMKEFIKDMPGVKVETNKEIEVAFK